jgi:hypothetical protein
LLHQLLQLLSLGYALLMEHLITDHGIVHTGAMGKHTTGDTVTTSGVMRHGATGLVEDIRRMSTDDEQA